jgi:hypothetical protein
MNKENIYEKISMEEIRNLIVKSPSNLVGFFNQSVKIQEKAVPLYGVLLSSEIAYSL